MQEGGEGEAPRLLQGLQKQSPSPAVLESQNPALSVLRNLATVAKQKHSSKAFLVSRIGSVSKWNSCWHYASLLLYFASREMWQTEASIFFFFKFHH